MSCLHSRKTKKIRKAVIRKTCIVHYCFRPVLLITICRKWSAKAKLSDAQCKGVSRGKTMPWIMGTPLLLLLLQLEDEDGKMSGRISWSTCPIVLGDPFANTMLFLWLYLISLPLNEKLTRTIVVVVVVIVFYQFLDGRTLQIRQIQS